MNRSMTTFAPPPFPVYASGLKPQTIGYNHKRWTFLLLIHSKAKWHITLIKVQVLEVRHPFETLNFRDEEGLGR